MLGPVERAVERRGLVVALSLLSLMAAPASAWAGERVWVHFVDKGPTARGDALVVALAERQAELPPRTLARRQRTRGAAAVDARDLPLSREHVAAVMATGARVRVQSRWLNAVSVVADSAQLAAIARLPGVERLELVARRRRLAPAPDGSGLVAAPHPRGGDETFGLAHEQLERLGIPRLRKCGLSGAGVVVGVLDSGFSLEHAALRGVEVPIVFTQRRAGTSKISKAEIGRSMITPWKMRLGFWEGGPRSRS